MLKLEHISKTYGNKNEKLIEWLEERIQSLEELAEFLPSGERGEIQRIEYEGMKQAYRLTIMKLKNEE